jgi:hypothetical protein
MDGSKARSFALRWAAFACVVVSSGACGAPEQEEVAESGMEATPSERQPTTATTDGEQTLQQHMEQISAVPADSLVHVMPQHLEKVGAMLDELDPTALGMQSDTVWRATLDSVQTDLGRMRDMRAAELREIMPDHRRRIDRIISMHDSAMGSER